MKHSILVACILVLFFVFGNTSQAEMRSWTGSNDKTIEAEFIALEGDIIRLRLKTGRESRVLLSKFSKEDQDYAKNLASTEDPFADAEANRSSDPSRFAEPENIRFTFAMEDKGRASFRIEKNPEPRQPFKGANVILQAAPKTDFKKRPDGMARLTFDFNEPPPRSLLGMNPGQIHDAKSKKLILQPNKQQFDGGCVFCTKEVMELPIRISFDARVVYKGECCIFEYLFHDYIIVFQVFAMGDRFGDDLEVLCRIGDKPLSGGVGRTYQELIHMKNISLDDVIESSFSISCMRTHENKRFRAGIGRNLNLPDGHEKTDNPLEVDNVIFEGRLLLE